MNPKHSPRLCLVEDDEIMGESLVDRFRLEGFVVDWHRRAGDAQAAIGRTAYDVVLSDIRLPDFTGEALFARLRESAIELPPFVFITGHGSIERAVALLKSGAADYVTKPFDLDELVLKVRQLCRNRSVLERNAPGMPLGVSPAMQKIEAMLRRLAEHASTVLITGQSGVGKERVALQLHCLATGGAERPFVAVNCGAVTETLIEAELFGHEKGAFTGAVRQRKGVFEQAHGGTLFLDEIGDMPLAMQVKLLRAIQEKCIVRVGGETTIPVEVRIICATNQDLRARVEEGAFREDLYYRINVVRIDVPALRDRQDDILELAAFFLDRFAVRAGRPRCDLSTRVAELLVAYDWPGNVRELENCMERVAALGRYEQALPEDLPEAVRRHRFGAVEEGGAEQIVTLDELERQHILRVLKKTGGNKTKAAQLLGLDRRTLYRKLDRYRRGESGIEPDR